MSGKQISNRLEWIDLLRGIAIMLMIPANLAYYYIEPHPMWFRLIGSYAAPIFVMLSAGMVMLAANKHSFSHFLKRGGKVIAIGILIDMFLWTIVPIISFDVLYLIGICTPLIYLLRNKSPQVLFCIGISICLLAELLQLKIGYHPDALAMWLFDYKPIALSRILQSIFIDGWFPILPWFGYACIGAGIFKIIFDHPDKRVSQPLFWCSIILLVTGFIALFIPLPFTKTLVNGGIVHSRFGFSEIFYPPTLVFALTLPGVLVCSILLAQYLDRTTPGKVLQLFGKNSLLIYFLHQAFGLYVMLSVLTLLGYEKIHNGYVFTLAVIMAVLFVWVVSNWQSQRALNR